MLQKRVVRACHARQRACHVPQAAAVALRRQLLRCMRNPGGKLQETLCKTLAVLCPARRWYPTVMTLPSGNILIVGGALVANGGGGYYNSQNPSWQILNPATLALSYKTPLPTSIILDAVPYALYPLMWQLPHTPSILARPPPPFDGHSPSPHRTAHARAAYAAPTLTCRGALSPS